MLPRKNILKINDYFGKKAPKAEKIIKNDYFSIKLFKNDNKYHRFGVVLSVSLDKKAVVRNRIKRAVLSFFGNNMNKFMVFDYLFFPNKKMTIMTRDEIMKLLEKALNIH